MASVSPSQRRTELDWLRVLLFSGLIAYHLGLIYAAWSPYALKSDHTHAWVEVLLLTTHPWRMSMLFLISGVATHYAVDKLGPPRLLVSRCVQLLPPLLFGVAMLVPVQTYLSSVETYGYAKGYPAYLVELFTHGFSITVQGRRIPQEVLAHLWFILYLWAYMVGIALVLWAAPRWPARLQAGLEKALSGAGLLIWPIVLVVALRVALFVPFGITLRFVDDWYNHAISFGAFLFGFGVARSESLWRRIEQLRWPAFAIAAVGWAGYAALWSGDGIPEYVERSHMIMPLLYPLEQWGAILAVLGFAHRHLRRDSSVIRYLNGGMFTYYLMHQPALLLVLHHTKPLGLHGALEALLVAAGTVAICGLTYELARGMGGFGRLLGVRPEGGRPGPPMGAGLRAAEGGGAP